MTLSTVHSYQVLSIFGVGVVQPPWAAGSAEILKHGLELLKRDSDTNRRLAMLSIDTKMMVQLC